MDEGRELGPAEGDPVEHVSLAAQHELGVAAARLPDSCHREPEDGHERLGVARAAGREPRQLAVEAVVDVAGREGEVERERGSRIDRATGLDDREEAGAKRRPVLRPDLESRRARVAAVPDQEVVADRECVGEVDPAVAGAWGLAGRPVMAAINLVQLLALVPAGMRAAAVSGAQPIDRDLAVVVDEATPLGELLRITRLSGGPILVEMRPFDEYRGPQIGAGKVSYAFALRFQPESAGDERSVEKALKRIRGALQHHLDAQIR